MTIVLIGMAGVGKTTVGRALAQRLGCPFVDTDDLIRGETGQALIEIIQARGEKAFLDLEAGVISRIDMSRSVIVATGGSAVYSATAMAYLKRYGTIVELRAAASDIRTWITDISHRGIIGLAGKTLEELYEERTVLYARYADHVIEIRPGMGLEEVVLMVMKKVGTA